jgi:hypothetical protein
MAKDKVPRSTSKTTRGKPKQAFTKNQEVNPFYTAKAPTKFNLPMNNYRVPSHALNADHPQAGHGDAYSTPTTYDGLIEMGPNTKKFPAVPPTTFYPNNLNSVSGESKNGRKSKKV